MFFELKSGVKIHFNHRSPYVWYHEICAHKSNPLIRLISNIILSILFKYVTFIQNPSNVNTIVYFDFTFDWIK